ncbi:MAG TPA: hypothetical protein VF258_09455 [Luteolibacter sp.]
MKLTLLFIALTGLDASAQTANSVNFIRQNQQETGVVWDMPVETTGAASSALALEEKGALFQLWSIDQKTAHEYLLDQKLVGTYHPKADVKIATLDPYTVVPRTRVDKPFTVEIAVDGLLTGSTLPDAATKVLLEQHIQSYAADEIALDPVKVASNTPHATTTITQNGKTVIKFPASSLTATDPTKASGEEHFIVHALADGNIAQSQIASGKMQVWPVASGAILGITPGMTYRLRVPTVTLKLNDLYPRSDTQFMLYEGSQIDSAAGIQINAFPWDSNAPKTTTITSNELDNAFEKNGTYTVALVSTTIYGTELLCDPITFSINRTINVNTMLVTLSNGAE